MGKLLLWFVYVMAIMVAHNYGQVVYYSSIASVLMLLLMGDEIHFKINGTHLYIIIVICYYTVVLYFITDILHSFYIICLFVYQIYYFIKTLGKYI